VSVAPPDNRAAYDDLVRRSPQGSVFASSWWLDAVAGGSWQPHLVEDAGDLAAWPTVVTPTRLGEVHGGAELTPFLGPLLPPGEGARRRSKEVAWVERLAEELAGAAHVDARCSPAFDYWTPLQWHGFRQTTHYTWRLEELSDADAVLAGVRSKARSDMRAAARELAVEEGTLGDFLALHAARFEGRRPTSGGVLERIEPAAAVRDARTILLARDGEGRVRAGAYLVHDARWTTYLVAATDGTRGAAALVVAEGIRRAAARGTGFDFEGSMLRNVESFVRSFGGTPTPYSIVSRTGSRPFAALRGAKRAARRALRR
jgi:hypothetical protein